MRLLPQEVRLLKELQEKFDDHYKQVLMEAVRIYNERAPLYDVTTPVWHRVEWPEGYLHEVGKKHGRIKNIFAAGGAEEKWPNIREEAVDMANYLAFMVAFGDLLFGRKEG